MSTTAQKTILVVDDDPQIRKLITAILKREKYGVITAANGNLALKALENQAVDLVITDLIMPEKEGIETIMEMRQTHPSIPIIAISGGGKLNPKTYLNIAKNIGAVSTMTKPIDTADLKSMVKSLLCASDDQPSMD
ncbi:response regulator receiver protein [Desulfosarcina variabilis str. Montpellier]|uniref:response regulator n=1 Tax=Desulfosarcina variabilis TaxID=2300 RepID=UPI003AFB07ED